MRYNFLKFRFWVVLIMLILLGVIISPFNSRGEKANLQLDKFLGKGILFGILGGYSSLVSDFIWLKSHMSWQEKDVARCMMDMELAVKIDPSIILFWSVGSSIIAYDMPHWIIDEKARTQTEVKLIKRRQAEVALKFLDEGLSHNLNNVKLLLDKIGIYKNVLGDIPSALKCYEIAVKQKNCPTYVYMSYSNLLSQEKEYVEAVRQLESVLKFTEKSHPMYKDVELRILELKEQEREEMKNKKLESGNGSDKGSKE